GNGSRSTVATQTRLGNPLGSRANPGSNPSRSAHGPTASQPPPADVQTTETKANSTGRFLIRGEHWTTGSRETTTPAGHTYSQSSTTTAADRETQIAPPTTLRNNANRLRTFNSAAVPATQPPQSQILAAQPN